MGLWRQFCHQLIKKIHLDKGSICFEKPEGGICLAYFERYFYNATSELCEIFIYGGCGGNQNNFETMKECYDNCEGNCSQEFFWFPRSE